MLPRTHRRFAARALFGKGVAVLTCKVAMVIWCLTAREHLADKAVVVESGVPIGKASAFW